jgi:kynurenine 3-monooxygenase
LLDEALSHDGIQVFFDHKAISADFDKRTLVVHDIARNTEHNVTFDFCVGADGSYSVIRRQLMRVVR